jgi:[ribosomal protein S5]-alanine N-acetyltransferase
LIFFRIPAVGIDILSKMTHDLKLLRKKNRNIKSRVIIRPPNDDDCEAFIAAVRRSRSLHRKWINPKAATRAGFEKYFKSSPAGQRHCFLVILRATDELVGVINLNAVVRGNFQNAATGYYAFAPHAGKV